MISGILFVTVPIMKESTNEPIKFFRIAHLLQKSYVINMSLLTGVRNVCVPAPAKINLFLSVGEKREDGFHELLTVMAKVRLFDHVIIEKSF